MNQAEKIPEVADVQITPTVQPAAKFLLIVAAVSRLKQAIKQRLALLHRAQWGYLLAASIYLLGAASWLSPVAALLLFTCCSMVAFTLDAWPQLEKFWHTLYGKALMLFSYAILLNLILAMAEASVNNLTGVRPDSMRYTVNLVALMLAPAFLIGGSAMLMLLYMMLHIGKICLFLLLRPLGVRSRRFFEGEAYPLSTLLLRILLLPLTCTMLMEVTQAYLQRNDFSSSVSLGQQGQQNIRQLFDGLIGSDVLPAIGSEPRLHWYEYIAVEFLYQVESQSKSTCQIHGAEHGVQQGETDLLVITPDETKPAGYSFSVRPCNSPGQLQLLQHLAAKTAVASN